MGSPFTYYTLFLVNIVLILKYKIFCLFFVSTFHLIHFLNSRVHFTVRCTQIVHKWQCFCNMAKPKVIRNRKGYVPRGSLHKLLDHFKVVLPRQNFTELCYFGLSLSLYRIMFMWMSGNVNLWAIEKLFRSPEANTAQKTERTRRQEEPKVNYRCNHLSLQLSSAFFLELFVQQVSENRGQLMVCFWMFTQMD